MYITHITITEVVEDNIRSPVGSQNSFRMLKFESSDNGIWICSVHNRVAGEISKQWMSVMETFSKLILKKRE